MADALGADTAVGLSYSSFAERFVAQRPGCVDFVEIPFEQLVHTPLAVGLGGEVPLLLHCASLSLAGNSPPRPGSSIY